MPNSSKVKIVQLLLMRYSDVFFPLPISKTPKLESTIVKIRLGLGKGMIILKNLKTLSTRHR